MTVVENYTQFGGRHSETAVLTNMLAAQGVKAPHTNVPFTEAMILGIGGGLGAGYILWEFKEHHVKVLVFGFQNNWQYPIKFLQNLCDRIGITCTFNEAGGQKAAAKQLEDALAAGQAALAWVDYAQMPYLHLPKTLEGHIGHFVGIYGIENSEVLVDDLAAKPFRVPTDVMASARGRIGSYKNRLMVITSGQITDLKAAIMSGLRDEVEHLSQKSDSFSLPVIRKWAKMMTDRKNAKGWPVVFEDRRGLYSALKSAYEGIELISTGGGAMRGLYADFLEEAAPIVDLPALNEVAKQYRALAAQWSDFADSILPDHNAPLRETRHLLRQRYEVLMSKGNDAWAEASQLTEQLNALHAQHSKDFPLDDAGIDDLFATMSEKLLALYEAEVATLAALKDAIQ